MSYDEDFNYDPDLEEAEYEAKKILKGMNSLQQKQMQAALNKKFAKKTAKYNKKLAEAGITSAELARLQQENPGLYDQAIDHAFKSYSKTLRSAVRNPKGQFTRQPSAKQDKPAKTLDEIHQADYGRRDNDRLDDIISTVVDSMGGWNPYGA